MKVGLVGHSTSGKTSLYRAAALGHAKGEVTAVAVPDPRFDAIVRQVEPKKITPATVVFHDDLEALQGSGRMISQRLLDDAKKMDVLLHVVRAFESDSMPYHKAVDPARDREALEVDLVIADLQVVENRLEKLSKSLNARNPGHMDYLEKVLFEKLKAPLEEGVSMRNIELADDEAAIARNYQFMSFKQMVVAFNVSEEHASEPTAAVQEEIEKLRMANTQAFAVCATLEDEVSQLDPVDQPQFLKSMGLTEPASARLIRAVYDALGLITFFTAGENETRAWPLKRGSNALKAAGTIHTDIAKGFIRAEVVHYNVYREFGSLDAAYKAGKMSLEGKDYVVQDGDLLHIRNKT